MVACPSGRARFVVCSVLVLVTACGSEQTTMPGGDAGADAARGDAGPARCSTDDQCSNSQFCDGQERCDPDAGAADARGCAPGAPPCRGATETCEETSDRCAPCADGDRDGVTNCDGDCDDTNPEVYLGATEVCDATRDEDCDPRTLGDDRDRDGFQASACCNGSVCGPDCNDQLNTVNPDAAESCNGNVDDDCDGLADANDGVCVPCPTGYVGFDGNCLDVNECAVAAFCGTGATGCANLPGTFTCACGPGYSASAPTGALCMDIDECAASPDPCGGTGACINVAGGYNCGCQSGYRFDGSRCVDVDECANDPCRGSPCTNTPGSYTCAGCMAGYRPEGMGCVDIDECATLTPCGTGSASCSNTPGSYACVCRSGYQGMPSGGTCNDVDECAAPTNPCGSGTCTNTPGSYVCGCGAGYMAVGGGCVDINECATPGYCGTGATGCMNMPGTFACACGAGFRAAMPTGALCQDIDECAAPSNPCGAGTCGNTVGGYLCICNAGYRQSASPPFTCINVNECTELTAMCDTTPLAPCMDTPGSYACLCPAGYGGDGRGMNGCVDLDECALMTDVCDPIATCMNTTGDYGCTCPMTFTTTTSGRGARACRSTAPALSGLVPSLGTLTPAFAPATLAYTVTLPPGAASLSLTPQAMFGDRLTITVNGVTVTAGTASAPVVVPFTGTAVISVVSRADDGTMITYTVTASRTSPLYVKSSNMGNDDELGSSIGLSADGNVMVVGAQGERSNATGVNGNQTSNGQNDAGAAYVFVRTAGTWAQQAYLKASNTEEFDSFGWAVAISADGSTIAVGAPYEDGSTRVVNGPSDDSAANAGAVYVFVRSGSSWVQQAYVKSNTANPVGDELGSSLALSSNGSTMIVGARTAGAYVFTRTGTTWSQQTSFAQTAVVSVAISAAGDRIAWVTSASALGIRVRSGSMWTTEASPGGISQAACSSVSMSAAGDRIAVGCSEYDRRFQSIVTTLPMSSTVVASAGVAAIVARSGSTWAIEAFVQPPEVELSDRFGGVSLSADGSVLLATADGENSATNGIGGTPSGSAADSGAAYLFTRSGTTWSYGPFIKASNSDPLDSFGGRRGGGIADGLISAAISGDASTIAIGAYHEESLATGIGGNQADNTGTDCGAVYVY